MKLDKLHPIHPFPARMAPSIVRKELLSAEHPLRVLDPMSGSGTTVVTAKALGHRAIGFDTDPLAVLIARGWATNVDRQRLLAKADEVVRRASIRAKRLAQSQAYPRRADEETRAFVRYWFDAGNRKQLAALSDSISRVHDSKVKTLLWCAFSRMIITKIGGVSLAMDVSHSRPHRVYEKAPLRALDQFSRAVAAVAKAAPFNSRTRRPSAKVTRADARRLPVKDNTVDLVITSPPYLNAIDYLRGHKLSLVWMGHSIRELRELRGTNVGAETSGSALEQPQSFEALRQMGRVDRLPTRLQGMLANYVYNMELVLQEISRVLKKNGRAVLVIGDSTIKGVFVKNSKAVRVLAEQNGLVTDSVRRRPLRANRRYLPPPSSHLSGSQLQARMREEVILTFRVA